MEQITLNHDQRLYVIPAGEGGYSCLGFGVVQRDTNHMLDLMYGKDSSHALRIPDEEVGTMRAYEKHQQLIVEWSVHKASRHTYFGPRTHPDVARILERYRTDRERELRLWLGDPLTGRDWCEENDGLGRIARSCGMVKVALLVTKGDIGGPAILTDCILRLMDVDSGRELYRAANYQPPNLEVVVDQRDGKRRWAVTRDNAIQARFDSAGEANAYVAFMHGCVSRPYYLSR